MILELDTVQIWRSCDQNEENGPGFSEISTNLTSFGVALHVLLWHPGILRVGGGG